MHRAPVSASWAASRTPRDTGLTPPGRGDTGAGGSAGTLRPLCRSPLDRACLGALYAIMRGPAVPHDQRTQAHATAGAGMVTVLSRPSGELYGYDPLFTSPGTTRSGAPRLRWDQLVWGWPPLLSPVSPVILGESAVRGRALWVSVGMGGPGDDCAQRLHRHDAPVSGRPRASRLFAAFTGWLLVVSQSG